MANSFSDDGQAGQDGVDAMFVLIASFIIFTMQSGFGLLESGESEIHIFTYFNADKSIANTRYMKGYEGIQ